MAPEQDWRVVDVFGELSLLDRAAAPAAGPSMRTGPAMGWPVARYMQVLALAILVWVVLLAASVVGQLRSNDSVARPMWGTLTYVAAFSLGVLMVIALVNAIVIIVTIASRPTTHILNEARATAARRTQVLALLRVRAPADLRAARGALAETVRALEWRALQIGGNAKVLRLKLSAGLSGGGAFAGAVLYGKSDAKEFAWVLMFAGATGIVVSLLSLQARFVLQRLHRYIRLLDEAIGMSCGS